MPRRTLLSVALASILACGGMGPVPPASPDDYDATVQVGVIAMMRTDEYKQRAFIGPVPSRLNMLRLSASWGKVPFSSLGPTNETILLNLRNPPQHGETVAADKWPRLWQAVDHGYVQESEDFTGEYTLVSIDRDEAVVDLDITIWDDVDGTRTAVRELSGRVTAPVIPYDDEGYERAGWSADGHPPTDAPAQH